MLEPQMTNPAGGGMPADPAAGGAPPGAAPPGAADPAAGGAPPGAAGMSTQEMIDALSKTMGADPEGMNEEQEFRVRQEARNMITDLQSSIGDELPDATRSQVNQMVQAWVSNDPIALINAMRDAMAVEEEKQTNARRNLGRDLRVQGTGAGKPEGGGSPRSMGEAVISASRMF